MTTDVAENTGDALRQARKSKPLTGGISKKASLSARAAALINPRQRSAEIASRVVADYYSHTQEPEVLYQARRQAIEEKMALDESLRVLLQTIPPEQ